MSSQKGVVSLYHVTKDSIVAAVESTFDIYTEIQAIVSGISSPSSKTNLPRAGKSIARTCGCRSGNQCRGMNDGVVWSSFMAMPAALLYFSKNWLWAGIFVFLSSCASVIYHVNREDKAFFLSDALLAAAAFFSTVPFCWQQMALYQIAITIFVSLAAFWFKGTEQRNSGRNYVFYHSIWHLLLGIGQFYLAVCV